MENGLHVQSQRRGRPRRPRLYQASEATPADNRRTLGMRKDLRRSSRSRWQSESHFPLIYCHDVTDELIVFVSLRPSLST